MKENAETKGRFLQVSDFAEVLSKCDYELLVASDERINFTRSLNPNGPLPRYELDLKIDEGRFRLFFQLHKRPYEDDHLSAKVSQELQRIIEILEEENHTSVPAQNLLAALRQRLLFGMADYAHIYKQKTGLNITQRVVSRKKRRRLQKESKSRWLERKYQEDY